MRILSLTAGAASMYCGSCLRDNALAAELIRQGHDVTLLPFYTPTLTDEENVSRKEQVFFGGISVYLEQHMPWFRGCRLFDAIVDAPQVIKAFTKGSIAVDPKQLGAMTVSTLRGANGHQRKEIDKLIEFVKGDPPPDVINIPYTLLISLAAPLKRALGRPVVVTLQGEDLFLEGLPEPYRREALDLVRAQVADVDLFIAVSDYYARFMSEYLRIPESKMRVATLGVNTRDLSMTDRCPVPGTGIRRFHLRSGFLRASRRRRVCIIWPRRISCCARQGTAAVAAASPPGILPPEHKPYLARIAESLRAAGLGDEFVYRGAVDRAKKVRFFHDIDVLSVPSGYHEPKGLYLLEAMACGVPVVQPNHGAFPEIIARTGGGVLSDSESGADVADAIHELWKDPARAAALGRAGAEGVRRHYTVQHMAAGVLKSVTRMLNANHLSKRYPTPAGELTVLGDVTFSLDAGESACVMGPSGSGKSTLLYILGGLEPPTSGAVQLDGKDPYALSADALAAFRNRDVGFVLQDHCLLPQCTVLENVLVPTLVGEADATAPDRARRCCRWWASASGCIIGRPNSPAARNSAPRSLAR